MYLQMKKKSTKKFFFLCHGCNVNMCAQTLVHGQMNGQLRLFLACIRVKCVAARAHRACQISFVQNVWAQTYLCIYNNISPVVGCFSFPLTFRMCANNEIQNKKLHQLLLPFGLIRRRSMHIHTHTMSEKRLHVKHTQSQRRAAPYSIWECVRVCVSFFYFLKVLWLRLFSVPMAFAFIVTILNDGLMRKTTKAAAVWKSKGNAGTKWMEKKTT